MAGSQTRAFRPFRSDKARERYLAHCDLMERSWPIRSETTTVDTPYGTTFMRVSGPPDGPPLVLLPGATTNSLCWSQVIGPLSSRLHTYALDAVYDAGRSVPTQKMKDTPQLTAWLDALLDSLSLTDGVNLMGLSYGAYATAEYALHAPERLSKVVWLSPAMTVAPVSKGFVRHIATCGLPVRAGYASFVRWVMPHLESQNEREFDLLVDELLLARRCYGPMSLPGGRVLSDAELAGMQVPVLYLIGEDEGVCDDPRGVIARLNEVAPEIRTTLIPQAGHDAVIVQSRIVSDSVLEFLTT